MAIRHNMTTKLRAGLTKRLAEYRREEDGAIIILALMMFVMILMVGGIAVDMMRYEAERVRLQGTADRAALAATMIRSNSEHVTPEDIARSYFAAEGVESLIEGRVIVNETASAREVIIAPRGRMNTTFMRYSGQDYLDMGVGAAAIEGLGGGAMKYELVLVLDISGSMGAMTSTGQNRMAELRDAAKEFAEMMLDGMAPENVAITIVPYNGWVLPPPGLASQMNNVTNPPGIGRML